MIRSGPDAGREFPLARGTAYVGRGRGCEVQLNDESVSRRHAKLVVAEVVEVVDLGSANGITAGGQQVARAHLKSGDLIRLGDTELEVHLLGEGSLTRPGSGVLSGDAGTVSFSRSPRVAPLYEGQSFQVPDLPERGKGSPLPWVAMMVPLLMGIVLFAMTRSPFSIVFMLMMPLMMAGTFWEYRRQQRKEFAAAWRRSARTWASCRSRSASRSTSRGTSADGSTRAGRTACLPSVTGTPCCGRGGGTATASASCDSASAPCRRAPRSRCRRSAGPRPRPG